MRSFKLHTWGTTKDTIIVFGSLFWITKYAIYKFSSKNAKIVFRSKFLASRTTGHFLSGFNRFFFFFQKIFSFVSGTSIYSVGAMAQNSILGLGPCPRTCRSEEEEQIVIKRSQLKSQRWGNR